MNIDTVKALYFSPTGGAERVCVTVARAIADRLQVPLLCESLNRPDVRRRERRFSARELLVIACPTYAGRLPNKIAPDLRDFLSGDGSPALPLVVFGNRSFDNALAELVALLSARGFRPIGAAAVVTPHAFTDALGGGRPLPSDLQALRAFAVRVADAPSASLRVPGDPDAPYYVPKGLDGQPVNFLKAKPVVDASRCSRCGACARRCPMGAIDPGDVTRTPGTCIKCQACVRRCTRRARSFDDPAFLSHVAMLERDFSQPKENQFF